ncbi:MAG: aldo/keto reductase family oxidoreductase [Puniceicoccaceae bacterium]
MQSIHLGTSNLSVSRIAYGCMRIAGTWNPSEITEEKKELGIQAIEAAYDAGIRFFDHADIYARGACESIFGEALRRHPKWRKKIVIATKCGIRFEGDPHPQSPHRYDFSAEHIYRSVEGSLARLGVSSIDLLQLHRPDYLADPEEIFKVFSKLKKEGIVHAFGVSNFRPRLVAAFRSNFDFPLLSHQVEISLCHLESLENGVLDQCLKQEMTPMAWGPLAGGALGDQAHSPDQSPLSTLHAVLDEVAASQGITRSQTAVAWLLRHPSNIIPVIGSTIPARIGELAAATAVSLSREDWYRILSAARGKPLE